eukprot:403341513
METTAAIPQVTQSKMNVTNGPVTQNNNLVLSRTNSSRSLSSYTKKKSSFKLGGFQSYFHDPELQLMNISGALSKEQRLKRQKMGLQPKEGVYAINQDDIIHAIPFGVFQIKFTIIIFIHYISSSFLIYNMAFFLLKPEFYQCTYSVDVVSSVYPCSREYVCNNDIRMYLKSWKANKQADPHLVNWIDQLDLHCLDSFNLGLLGALICLGMAISTMLIPILVEKFGRRIFTYMSSVIQLACFFAFMFSTDLYTYMTCLFFIGLTLPIKHFVTYPHLMELIPRQQIMVGGMIRCVDALVFSISPLILNFLSDDTNLLLKVAIALNFISFFGLLALYVPESIKFNLTVGLYQRAQMDILYICQQDHVTKVKAEQLQQLVQRYQYQNEDHETGIQNYGLLQRQASSNKFISTDHFNKFNLINLALMMTCWIATKFTFMTLIFVVKYLPGDIFTTTALGGASALIFLLQELIYKKVCPKKSQQFAYFISVLALLVMIFFDKHSANHHVVVYAIVTLVLRIGVNLSFGTIFIQHQDLFERDFIGISYAACTFFSRLFAILAPIIVESKNKKMPLYAMLAINGLAFVATSLLVVRKKE